MPSAARKVRRKSKISFLPNAEKSACFAKQADFSFDFFDSFFLED